LLYDLEQGDVVLVYTGWAEQHYFDADPRIQKGKKKIKKKKKKWYIAQKNPNF
jgi:kynurenine formamidase